MGKITLNKIIALICVFVMLIPMFSSVLSAVDFEFVYEEPVNPGMWEDVDFDTDHAYSIAFVGDTQYITSGDRFLGTSKLKQQFKYIADTAEERKLEHVFVLGDLTDNGFRNDCNLGGRANDPVVTKEWEIVQEAYFQLGEAGVSYSLCRGNHDDYMMDDYFNVPEYTDQFKDCGGFYSDSEAKHIGNSESRNPGNYIYWSAKSGYHKESVVNSWKTMELGEQKYLFVTVDYNPTYNVLSWLDSLLASYPDHRAIITTHSYLAGNGSLIEDDSVNTRYHRGIYATVLWENVLKNHPNVFMVVSGHVGVSKIVYSYNKGIYGNRVLQLLVDPQNIDTYESDSEGTIVHGTQDTGLVLYMNFSEDGNSISFNYYSTLLDKFLKGTKLKLEVYNQNGNVDWIRDKSDNSHAYSFAFVGDTENITVGDYYTDTNKLEKQYKYIADTAKERKLAHVSILGDITALSYKNDPNMSGNTFASAESKEWDIAKSAITQLNAAGVPYSICRGDNDDYMINDYFNIPAYTDMYKSEGGFFSDTEARYSNGDKVYRSAKSGEQTASITNSYKTLEVCKTKYLFITVDYNPTDKVLEWVDGILASYPDHRAIVTTHAYLDTTGDLLDEINPRLSTDFGNNGEALWNEVLKKHANVFIIVSGHKQTANVAYSFNKGDNGNKVLQVLVNPELCDKKEINEKGDSTSGTQDVGLVLYMNFSEDGSTITFNYYSTLLKKMVEDSDFVIRMDDKIDTTGEIDLSDLGMFGQITPVVGEKTTVTLDGAIKEGEYSTSKVTDRFDLGFEAIRSNMTEYFAYDDEYLYYAISANMDLVPYKLTIHLGNSNFTVEELENGAHDKSVTVVLGKDYCRQLSNNAGSNMIENKDIFCETAYNEKDKRTVYEIKIRRGYFAENNVPDDVLSYTVDFDLDRYCFKLKPDANEHLKSLGVQKDLSWTYNYVYFGAKHSLTEEESTALTDTEPVTTESEKNKGCRSVAAAAPILIVAALTCAITAAKRGKENDQERLG